MLGSKYTFLNNCIYDRIKISYFRCRGSSNLKLSHYFKDTWILNSRKKKKKLCYILIFEMSLNVGQTALFEKRLTDVVFLPSPCLFLHQMLVKRDLYCFYQIYCVYIIPHEILHSTIVLKKYISLRNWPAIENFYKRLHLSIT